MSDLLQETKEKYDNENCLMQAILDNNMTDFWILLREPNISINQLENKPENLRASALHRAVQVRNYEMVSVLLQFGADPNVLDGQMRTPLHYLSTNVHTIIDTLDSDDESDVDDLINRTAQITALLLHTENIDLNAQDNTGRTPIHLCIYANNWWQTNRFIENNANLDIQDSFGETVLHAAAKFGYNNIVSLLLNAGASRSIKTNQDLSAYDIAINNNHEDTADIIESYEPRFEHEVCIMCFEPVSNVNTTRLPCGHGFHTTCLTQWNIHHMGNTIGTSRCPTCRRQYISELVNFFPALSLQPDGKLKLKY